MITHQMQAFGRKQISVQVSVFSVQEKSWYLAFASPSYLTPQGRSLFFDQTGRFGGQRRC